MQPFVNFFFCSLWLTKWWHLGIMLTMLVAVAGYTLEMPALAPKVAITIRMRPEEKEAFDEAAELAGLSLNSWMITRLRDVSAEELEKHNKKAAFLKPVPKKR